MTEASHSRILVAGIGNIFLGDDGFGCAAVRALKQANMPSDVKVVDFGIRGLDLAYALLEPYETVILVDAISRGEDPGTIYILQPERSAAASQIPLDPHSMDPVHLMAMARSLGEIKPEIFIVGCEPLDFGDELMGRMELSLPVSQAVPEGVRATLDLIGAHRHTALIPNQFAEASN